MKIKIVSCFLISLFVVSPVFALTEKDIDLLYEAGFISYDKVAPTKKALKSSSSTSTTKSTPAKTETKFIYGNKNVSTNSCLKLSSDLRTGMSNVSVTSLQNFLKSKGHFSADSTGYFGGITRTAVESFQKAQNIVLSGTPETTGFGNVGPATRAAIEKISCTGSSSSTSGSEYNNFFGYNLDDLFNNTPDLNYDIAFNDKINLETDIDFKIPEINFKDIDIETDIDFKIPEINFKPVNFGSGSVGDASVLLYAKAVNGQFLRGGNATPVAVKSNTVELAWESKSSKDCYLSGDFKEQKLSVPTDGSANLTMTKPTGGRATGGFPLFQFRISCNASTTKAYALPSSDSIKLLVYNPGSTTNSTSTTQ